MPLPLKLDDARIEVIAKNLASGCFIDEAGAAAGIHRSTMNGWLKRGYLAAGRRDAGEELEGNDLLYVKLWDRVTEAKAVAIVYAHARIRAAMADKWQAAAWYLAVVDPQRYSSHRRPEENLPTPAQVARMAVEDGEVRAEDEKPLEAMLSDFMEKRRQQLAQEAAVTNGSANGSANGHGASNGRGPTEASGTDGSE